MDDPNMTINLSAGVMEYCATLAIRENLGLPRQQREDWNVCIERELAKAAFASFKGELKTKGLIHISLPDDYVVRATHRRSGRLIIFRHDDPDKMYVLVTGKTGRYVIKGWKLGREGMMSYWWKDPTGKGRDAYFVPQKHLVEFEVTT